MSALVQTVVFSPAASPRSNDDRDQVCVCDACDRIYAPAFSQTMAENAQKETYSKPVVDEAPTRSSACGGLVYTPREIPVIQAPRRTGYDKDSSSTDTPSAHAAALQLANRQAHGLACATCGKTFSRSEEKRPRGAGHRVCRGCSRLVMGYRVQNFLPEGPDPALIPRSSCS